MNKRRGILEELLSVKHDYIIKDYMEKLIIRMLAYYDLHDLDHKTNHHAIFKALYKSRKIAAYEDIADEYFISISTLKRYLSRYNRLAKKIIKHDGKIKRH